MSRFLNAVIRAISSRSACLIPSQGDWLGTINAFPGQVQDRAALLPARGGTSVPDLVAAIEEYVTHHNSDPKPFLWTRNVRDILQKVIPANGRLSSKQNETPH